jgi:hypothetical protein
MRFRPVLFIGLGEYGSAIARAMADSIRTADPEISALVGLIEARDNGAVLVDGVQALQIDFGAAATFADRFTAIAAAEEPIANAINSRLGQLRRRDVLVPLKERQYEIREETGIYFVSPLCDDVGSVALIAFLEIMRQLANSRLAGQQLHSTVLGFFPDLFPTFRDVPERYARTYVCVQEIEYLSTVSSLQEKLPYDFVSLFTARNEVNEDLGSYEEVAAALGEIYGLALHQEISVDESFATALVNKTEDGIVTRFSSAGMSQLVFPREAILRALDGHFAAEVLEDYGIGSSHTFDRHVVSVDVRDFIWSRGLDRIEEPLQRDRLGKPYEEFSTAVKYADDFHAEDLLRTIEKDAEQHMRKVVSATTAEINKVRDGLVYEHGKALEESINARINDKQFGTDGALAFLDVLINKPSDFTVGDVVDDAVTADNIDLGARKYFDEVFGIRRADLSRLQQEIISKEAALDHYESRRAADGESAELKTATAQVQKDLDTARKAHEDLRQKVDLHDLELEDGAKRRFLLTRRRSELEVKVREQTAELKTLDQAYFERRRIHAEEQKQLNERIRKICILGLAGFAAAWALAGIVRYFTGPLPNFWIIAAKIIGGLTVVYLIWAAFQIYQALARVEQAHRSKVLAGHKKRDAFDALLALHRQLARTPYDFARHGAAVDWAVKFRDKVTVLREDIGTFRERLAQLHTESLKSSRELTFSQTLISRTVAGADDVQRLAASAGQYEHERYIFSQNNPLSGIYDGYRTSGGLAGLESELRKAAGEVFGFVRAMSIEKFLVDGEAAHRVSVGDNIARLFHFGSPLVQLSVERGDDHLRNIAYLGTSGGEGSLLLEAARARSYDPLSFRTRSDTIVMLVTAKVGFPAYHVALINYCDQALQSSGDPDAFRAVPEWRLQSLRPSALELGNENDPARQLAVKSMALGVVKRTDKGFLFEDRPIETISSYRGFIEMLRSLRGSGLKARLQLRTSEAIKEPAASGMLSDFLHAGECDAIDQLIIQQMLDRLDD